MEPQFNTSFIPKKSLQEDVTGTTPGKYVNRRTVHGPGFFLMLLVFIVTIIAAGSIFAYTKVIQGRIDASLTTLERDRASYKPETIEALRRVDERMKGAERLIISHQTVSALLTTLENLTLKTVRYSKVDFTGAQRMTNEQVGEAYLSMSGSAKELKSVALQMDQFDVSEVFGKPGVTKLERAPEGSKALFTMQVSVDPQILKYASTLTASLDTPVIETPEETLVDTSSASTTAVTTEGEDTDVPPATSTTTDTIMTP